MFLAHEESLKLCALCLSLFVFILVLLLEILAELSGFHHSYLVFSVLVASLLVVGRSLKSC